MPMDAHCHQVQPEQDEQGAHETQQHTRPAAGGLTGLRDRFETIKHLPIGIEDGQSSYIFGDPEKAFRTRRTCESFAQIVVLDEVIPAHRDQGADHCPAAAYDHFPADTVEITVGEFHEAGTRRSGGQAVVRDRLLGIPSHELSAAVGPDIIQEYPVVTAGEVEYILFRFRIPQEPADAGGILEQGREVCFRKFDVSL